MTDKKEIKTKTVTIPTPRMLKLSTGEQVICIMYVQEGSDFIRLSDPYKIELHNLDMDPTQYYMEERMSMKPWVWQSSDKIFSIHKNNIMTIAMPNEEIKDYYNNIRLGNIKIPAQEKLKPMPSEDEFNRLLDKLGDEDYFDVIEHLKGKKTVH